MNSILYLQNKPPQCEFLFLFFLLIAGGRISSEALFGSRTLDKYPQSLQRGEFRNRQMENDGDLADSLWRNISRKYTSGNGKIKGCARRRLFRAWTCAALYVRGKYLNQRENCYLLYFCYGSVANFVLSACFSILESAQDEPSRCSTLNFLSLCILVCSKQNQWS